MIIQQLDSSGPPRRRPASSFKPRPLFFAGGAREPGRGLPAAAQHALPHAVVLPEGSAAAQRDSGVAPPTDRPAGAPPLR